MSYQGGKGRLSKRIYNAILDIEKEYTNVGMDYFEPFVGYASVMKYFASEKDRKCEACDANESVILLWQSLQDGWIPMEECNKEIYNNLKKSNVESAEKGFYLHVCSFGGIYGGSYRSDKDYVSIGRRSLLKKIGKMKDVKFLDSRSYDEFEPHNKLIYLDPPYVGNTYGNINKYFKFDHTKFWNIVRKWSVNNLVIVSERQAPDDFTKVWEHNINVRHAAGSVKKESEALFMLK